MSRSLKYDIPGVDRRVGMAEVAAAGWDAVFAGDLRPPLQLVVEIGFGRGEFLLELATRKPEKAFVGVDVSFKRVLKMARKVAAHGLSNVRLLEGRGQVVVKELLAPGSVEELWVNFSDPWPKDRHRHRRLLQSEFVHDAARSLAPHGVFRVATDDEAYARQIHEVLSGEARLENQFAPEPWRPKVEGRVETGYEADWRKLQRQLYFFDYCRRPDPSR